MELRERDIVCFCQDWTGDPLSKTHLMRILARENRILWVSSIGLRRPTASRADAARIFAKISAAAQPVREVEPHLFVLSPLAIPAYDSAAIRRFNTAFLRFQVMRAVRKLGFRDIVSYVFIPSAGLLAGTLGEETLLYHCVDEYSAFSGVHAQSILRIEEELCRRADLVIVSSDALRQTKQQWNPNTVIVRHGVDFEHFRKALSPDLPVPADLRDLPKPVIGFHGLIADWVDVDLLAHLARRMEQASIVLIGSSTTDVSELRRMRNVHFLGRKRYEELPAYCKGFDVAMLPFRLNELTLAANPLKVREYLAAGLPVVSTRIPEVESIGRGRCRIADGREAFVAEVEKALESPGPSGERSDGIRHESWEARVEEIRGHLAAARGARRPRD